jgi:hypothetical protein
MRLESNPGSAWNALQDEHGFSGRACSDLELVHAKSKPVLEHHFRKALGETLGADTVLSLRRVDFTGMAHVCGTLRCCVCMGYCTAAH